MFDEDIVKKDKKKVSVGVNIGVVVIPVSKLVDFKPTTAWYPLKAEKEDPKRKKKLLYGEVSLTLAIRPADAASPGDLATSDIVQKGQAAAGGTGVVGQIGTLTVNGTRAPSPTAPS